MFKKTITGILIMILSSGCATSIPTKQAFQTLGIDKVVGKDTKSITEDDRQIIAKDVEDLISYCKPILSGMETDSKKKSKWAYILSMAGLLSGAVVAPALTAASATSNAAWISATAGFGGATNMASEALRSTGLSGTTDATTRNNIIERLRTQLTILSDTSKSVTDIRTALILARTECTLYNIAIPDVHREE